MQEGTLLVEQSCAGTAGYSHSRSHMRYCSSLPALHLPIHRFPSFPLPFPTRNIFSSCVTTVVRPLNETCVKHLSLKPDNFIDRSEESRTRGSQEGVGNWGQAGVASLSLRLVPWFPFLYLLPWAGLFAPAGALQGRGVPQTCQQNSHKQPQHQGNTLLLKNKFCTRLGPQHRLCWKLTALT